MKPMKLSYLLLFLFLISCKVQQSTSTGGVNKLAHDTFGEDCVVEYNSNNTFALCYNYQKINRMNPGNAMHFGIIDVKKQIIIYSEKKHHAKVRWINDYEVEVKARTEVQSVNSEINNKMSYYIIDVRTLQKRY